LLARQVAQGRELAGGEAHVVVSPPRFRS